MIEKLMQFQSTTRNLSDSELWRKIVEDADFRAEIAVLTSRFFNRRIGSCNNCYFEECRNLNLLTRSRIMKKEACKYQLKSGALLIDPDDPTKNCTKFNLTNELAEYHLRRNPKCAKFFSAIPKEPLTATDTTKDVVSVNVEKEQKRKRKSRK